MSTPVNRARNWGAREHVQANVCGHSALIAAGVIADIRGIHPVPRRQRDVTLRAGARTLRRDFDFVRQIRDDRA